MYKEYEQRKISATIYYYDNEYTKCRAEAAIGVLEENGILPIDKICAGKLTKGRYISYQPSFRNILIQAYSEKNVFCVSGVSTNTESNKDDLDFLWTYTFLKNSRIKKTGTFIPWNTFTIQASYEWLRNETNYSNYLKTIKMLIFEFNAFYANIDDVDMKVTLLKEVHENHFTPNRIQQVYWGNYWGPVFHTHIVNLYDQKYPISNIENIGNGLFFTLSDYFFDGKDVSMIRSYILSQLLYSDQ